MKLTPELCEALVNLKPYAAFQTFLRAVQQDGVDTMLDLVKATPDAVGRLQGRAGLSQDILTVVEQAAETLEKYRRSQSPQTGEDARERSTRISSTGRGAF